MKEVKVPKLSYKERYKRVLDGAYASLLCSEEIIEANVESDKALKMRRTIHEALGSGIAKKLVKKFKLKPTVEDALKLFKLYSSEVWGYGADEYVSIRLEGSNKGTFTDLVCRGWELQKRAGKEQEMRKMDCAQGCIAEHMAVLRELSPDIKLTWVKAYPWGDDRCEYVIERQISR